MVAGAGAQGRGALISRPEHRTLGLASGYEGGAGRWSGCLGLTAGQTPVKEYRIKVSCSSPDFVHRLFWFGSQFQAFLSLQSGNGKCEGCLQIEDSRHGNRLGRNRTGRSGQGPGSLGAGVGVGAAWAGLGWAVTVTATATAFCSFSVGPPAIPVRLRPRPRRCRLVSQSVGRATCSSCASLLM